MLRRSLLGAVLSAFLATSAAPSLAAQPAPTGALAEKGELCRRMFKASGYEAAAEASTRASMRELSREFRVSDPKHSRAFDVALEETLRRQGNIFRGEVSRICVNAYAVSDLRSIVGFFESPEGRTFVKTNATVVLPAMETALEALQPKMADDLLRSYCAQIGECESAGR